MMHQAFATPSNITALTIYSDISSIRKINPIIHNVTNFVVMQTTANILLAIGSSPIMAHAPNELAEITNISNALVINIGTLDDNWIASMKLAQIEAQIRHLPIIFDPVGAGATTYRTQIANTILEKGVSIVRGNASEIMALANADIKTKGVDSTHESDNAIHAAKSLANQYKCVVVVSGKTDFIIDKHRTLAINHGSSLFTKVTGMGCSATALIGVFAAINPDFLMAAAHAMATFSIAGEIAEKNCQGPGSFYMQLLDTLFNLSENNFKTLNISENK